ncbi:MULTISPECIES: sulfotransferase family protein [Pseudoalteromonas]|uniref:Sulfotransferase n=1 Tax=Pseudoalteromonas amylolytica TaxID=1859457 RepID=A0A1S1N086_9GAMM|nr:MULTISPECIES: sulfotransferase [Pseudoalteromonas]OHU90681.1 hypothetical protein BFC16_03505 [Pseudoalteromonas sp. JW3]OHU92698.1 hypothetical protein BET10_04385 [Pseudoalteromonas amylolytica]
MFKVLKDIIKKQFILLLRVKNWFLGGLRKLDSYCAKPVPSEANVVFIIGVPRSGTTLLYQVLVDSLDFTYINNFIEKFYALPNTSFWLSRKFIKYYSSSFESAFGDTSRDGLGAPCQGISFWYKWFSKNQIVHAQGLHDVDEKLMREMTKTIASITDRAGKPLLVKQLSFGQKLEVIHHYFPNAKYIYLERDLLEVAQSIYNAMDRNGVGEGAMWGGQFKGYEKYLKLKKTKMIPHQVIGLKKGIEEGLNRIPKNQIMKVHYEDLCINTQDVAQRIANFTGQSFCQNKSIYKNIKYSKKVGIPIEDYNEMILEFHNLNECKNVENPNS